jgi:hypothetical protein
MSWLGPIKPANLLRLPQVKALAEGFLFKPASQPLAAGSSRTCTATYELDTVVWLRKPGSPPARASMVNLSQFKATVSIHGTRGTNWLSELSNGDDIFLHGLVEEDLECWVVEPGQGTLRLRLYGPHAAEHGLTHLLARLAAENPVSTWDDSVPVRRRVRRSTITVAGCGAIVTTLAFACSRFDDVAPFRYAAARLGAQYSGWHASSSLAESNSTAGRQRTLNSAQSESDNNALQNPNAENGHIGNIEAGTIISAILIRRSQLDLVIEIKADVLDAGTQHKLLIPSGTKILGTYLIRDGKKPLQSDVLWRSMIYPDGRSLILERSGNGDRGSDGFAMNLSMVASSASADRIASAAQGRQGTNRAAGPNSNVPGTLVDRRAQEPIGLVYSSETMMTVDMGSRLKLFLNRSIALPSYK